MSGWVSAWETKKKQRNGRNSEKSKQVEYRRVRRDASPQPFLYLLLVVVAVTSMYITTYTKLY